MATVASEIGKVKSKGTSYRTAYLKTQDDGSGWIHWILGYSKSSGICTVLVRSPFCPYGEIGTAYFRDLARMETDPGFVETPMEVVKKTLK
jgi:hypothetical protein